MVSILNPDLYARFSTSEGMRMKLLSKEETSIVKAFLKVPIPEYVLAYADGQIDLLDCYEVAFNFANELLRGRKINPNASPWGGDPPSTSPNTPPGPIWLMGRRAPLAAE